MLSEWLLVALGILLTFGTAVFVASEFSLVTLDPGVVEKQTEQDDRRGQSVLRALRRLSTELSGAQVGITLTTILLGYTTQPAVATMLRGALDGWLSTAVSGAIAVIVALILVNGFSMVVGELVPKNFAIARPLGTARTVVPVQSAFTSALHPVIAFFNGSANALLRRFGIEPREELSGGRSPQELAALVRRSARVGHARRVDRDAADQLDRLLRAHGGRRDDRPPAPRRRPPRRLRGRRHRAGPRHRPLAVPGDR